MRRSLLLALVCSAAISACGGPLAEMDASLNSPHYASQVDPYTRARSAYYGDLKTYPCVGQMNGVPEATTVPSVDFAFSVVRNKGDATSQYAIVAQYYGSAWLFIPPHAVSLEMLVDSRPHRWASVLGSSDDRHLLYDPVVIDHETAIYYVGRSDIQQIADASRVQFRLTGDNGFVQGCVLDRQLASIHEFLDRTGRAFR